MLVGALARAGWTLGALRVGAAAAVVGTTAVMACWLGRDRRYALLFGANPLIMIEAANGGHLDALVALAISGMAWCTARRRHWLAGLFLGVAASIKLVPLLLVPVLLRRGRWRTSLTAVGMTIAGYVPHLLVVGTLVLGYLPGYWSEEGYGAGGRFALLAWLPADVRTPVALSIAAAAGRNRPLAIGSRSGPCHLHLALWRELPRGDTYLPLVRNATCGARGDVAPVGVAVRLAGGLRRIQLRSCDRCAGRWPTVWR